jgi:hypothetical protein
MELVIEEMGIEMKFENATADMKLLKIKKVSYKKT